MNLIRRRGFRALMVALIVGSSAGMMGMSSSGGDSGTVCCSSGSSSGGTIAVPTNTPAAPIPEPTGFVVFALGIGVVGLVTRRRNRNS